MRRLGPSHRSAAESSARELRRLPWLLATVWLTVLAARAATLGLPSPAEAAAWIGAAVATGVLVLLWVWRLERHAQVAGSADPAVLFTCSNAVNRAAVAGVPQFREALRRVRLAFVVGGWLTGRLEVRGADVRWTPGTWTRRAFRATELRLSWDEVDEVVVLAQPGPRQPGVLGLRLRNGATCAFMVTGHRRLQQALAEQDAIPYIE